MYTKLPVGLAPPAQRPPIILMGLLDAFLAAVRAASTITSGGWVRISASLEALIAPLPPRLIVTSVELFEAVGGADGEGRPSPVQPWIVAAWFPEERAQVLECMAAAVRTGPNDFLTTGMKLLSSCGKLTLARGRGRAYEGARACAVVIWGKTGNSVAASSTRAPGGAGGSRTGFLGVPP